ncbi:DUF1763-domain-containing protein [Rhizodiscina lignyota]|uniref:DUF1763-domain-containing protein n=1 Tax=Rhizodiscina lignyota TaxID=1504668 RepID=A0A9P4IJR9_9PEZI|nr:DUF1763-domain-containing protein [Rhizodiscina lignyota]
MCAASSKDILTAYRNLYRQGLRAVQYSLPARITLRDRIRRAFRRGDPADFDQNRVNNTLVFLSAATVVAGVEHHVLRNLLLTWFYEPDQSGTQLGNDIANLLHLSRDPQSINYRTNTYDSFNHTIRMLNESMELCLPTGD